MGDHTPTPWFVSGVRFRMNGSEWLSVNRYDETRKQDENIACVGYDQRNGLGQADAAFIVKAVNSHDEMLAALLNVRKIISDAAMTGFNCHDGDWAERIFHSQQATSAAIKTASYPLTSNLSPHQRE